jgi:hypothetical protein
VAAAAAAAKNKVRKLCKPENKNTRANLRFANFFIPVKENKIAPVWELFFLPNGYDTGNYKSN